MTDITACKWEWCKFKNECYRYLCDKDEYLQSYFIDSPIKDWECEFLRLIKNNNEWGIWRNND